VQHQWNALWHSSAHEFLRAKLFGFQPFHVAYRRAANGPHAGLIEVERLVDVHPKEARLLVADDKLVGFEVEQSRVAVGRAANHGDRQSIAGIAYGTPSHPSTNSIQHVAPHALVVTFDAECANPYGCALLARAYPAWWEKWMPGGAKRTLRLRMIKDAYIGDILWYPQNQFVQTPDGRDVSWRDMARQIVENRHTGGSMTLPLIRDSQGNKLLDYTPPQGVPGYTQIFHWKRDLDLEIWKALEVPPEIIQASSSGSGYSGRWIPFAVALSAVHQELIEVIRSVDRDILRPIAWLNFGRQPQYDIRPKSLVETYARKFDARIANV
jgi:hypothetical protein